MSPDDFAALLLIFCALSFVFGWMTRAHIARGEVLDAQIEAERNRFRAMFGEEE